MSDRIEADLHSDEELVQVFPFGVTLAADQSRPIMVFKDKEEKITLPVWLSPLDAGISLSQSMSQSPRSSPHHLTLKIMKELGVELKKCLFVEIKGHRQMVGLHFEGHSSLKTLVHRADESLSFCMSSKAEFFVPRWFVEESRQLNSVMEGVLKGLELEPNMAKNNHPYLM